MKSLLNSSLVEVKCPTGIYSIFIQFTWLWSIGWIKFSKNGVMTLQPPRKAFIDVVKSFWIALVVQGSKKRNGK